jgi:hypothetical protein
MVHVFWVHVKYILNVVQNTLMYKKMCCDANLMSNILCGCEWKEINNLNSWWHKTPPKYQTIVHHEFWRHRKLFVYKFMVFEVCNSMKMNFCVGFGDGVGLLLQVNWLLNEECRSRCEEIGWRKGELRTYKHESSGLQGGNFLNCN